VIVVEGEKTADAARAVFPSAIVVTSPGGSNAADATDWKPIANRNHILIVPDFDAAGVNYANSVARILSELGVSRILMADTTALASTLPNSQIRELVQGWDIADGVEEGWDLVSLRSAINAAAKPYQPEQFDTKGREGGPANESRPNESRSNGSAKRK
jgi:putative DNA primase/helicase